MLYSETDSKFRYPETGKRGISRTAQGTWKTDAYFHDRHGKRKVEAMDVFLDFEMEEEPEQKIVKRKTVDNKPMSEEEAILQMELLDHDFFIFNNTETNNACVIYKRKDNSYGLIEIV